MNPNKINRAITALKKISDPSPAQQADIASKLKLLSNFSIAHKSSLSHKEQSYLQKIKSDFQAIRTKVNKDIKESGDKKSPKEEDLKLLDELSAKAKEIKGTALGPRKGHFSRKLYLIQRKKDKKEKKLLKNLEVS